MNLDDEPPFALVTCVAQVDLAELEDVLRGYGFAVLTLHGKTVRDKATLLAQVETDLPHIEGMRPGNWDALADWFWNLLRVLDGDRVALLWTDADQIVQGDLQDLLDALRVLGGVADAVREGGGLPRPTAVLIFLLGDARGFPSLAV